MDIMSLAFSKFWCGAKMLFKVVHNTWNFFKRNFPPKLGEMGHNRAFEFTGKFGHYFFLDLVYNESVYCLFIPTQ